MFEKIESNTISELNEFLEGNQTYEDYYKVLEKYI